MKCSRNTWKSGQTTWNYGQKWRPTLFDFKKLAPNVCRITCRPFLGAQKKVFVICVGGNIRTKSCPKISRASLEKFGKKSFAPPKIACSYTDDCYPTYDNDSLWNVLTAIIHSGKGSVAPHIVADGCWTHRESTFTCVHTKTMQMANVRAVWFGSFVRGHIFQLRAAIAQW